MNLSRKLSILAALAAVVVYFGGANAADEDKKPDCKAVMKTQNTIRGAILPKKGEPNWEEASKKSKTWLAAAEGLGKNEPPVGDKDSWKEQTGKYVTNVKAVDEAVTKKDAAAVSKALGTFSASCMGCHSKHKPKAK